ncbi:MAG: hypothetical protein IPI01_00205 [Ignavibacteriae bacterium]|nr:hypothetical protein [Ignavibacteriota bacterium]
MANAKTYPALYPAPCGWASCVLVVLMLQGTPGAVAQDVNARLLGSEGWRNRFSPIEILLSRPLSGGERVALVIGTTDVTDLCRLHGDTLSYQPEALAAPPGAVAVSVFIVYAGDVWTQVAGDSIHILVSGGFERSILQPSFTLSYSGQMPGDEEGSAETPSPSHELNGQLSVKGEVERKGVGVGFAANIVGVSDRAEALRFSELGEDASKIDLASGLVEAWVGVSKIAAGHISHGRSRHLLNNFASRGITVTTQLGGWADLSGSVMNATGVVGWSNLAGLANAQHRIYSGTLGVNVLPLTTATLRIEGSYVHGSQLPLANFGQAVINDAEESGGASVRLVGADPGRTITLDAGVTLARFVNPRDPLLEQGLETVPVQPETRQARYADVTWDVVREAALLPSVSGRLSVVYRHERVDPLFRTVGASVRPDLLSHTVEAHGGLGPLQMDFVHQRAEDNLAAVTSIPKSETRQTALNMMLVPPVSGGLLPGWLPSLTYSLNRTGQESVTAPDLSGSTPGGGTDQVTTTHAGGVEWQGDWLRIGYRCTYTDQDNSQGGLLTAGTVNRSNGLAIAVNVLEGFTAGLEGALESNESTGTGTVLQNRRIGANILLPLTAGAMVTFTGSMSTSGPDDGLAAQQQAQVSIEASYAFDLSSAFVFTWQGRSFIRYSWNEFTMRDDVFDLRAETRSWAINAGLSFSIF